MNLPLKLWQLGKAYATRIGVIGLVVAGTIGLSTRDSRQAVRVDSPLENRVASLLGNPVASPLENRAMDLPIVSPIVSSDPTSEGLDLSSTAGVDVKENRQVQLHPTQIALKQAEIAVSRSQAELVRSRINSIEFQAKHNNAKILHRQGKVSRQQLNTAKSAHKLMQLQQSSASIGLQESQAQLIAAKAEVIKLERKSNHQVKTKVREYVSKENSSIN